MGNYKIKLGDTLTSIAKNNNTTIEEILKANKNITNPNFIIAGSTLNIPNSVNATLLHKADLINKSKEEEDGFQYDPFKYADYKESSAVKQALTNKTAAENALGAWELGEYTNEQYLKDVMEEIQTRPDFSYDLNGDALYQQYKDKYIQQGKMAMQDTMGQAAAMTGGYGNSYAAAVGNQAYQASLENLNDIVPELYQMAYDKYNQEGQDLYNQYSMLSDDKSFWYGTRMDEYNQLVGDRDYYANAYDNERNYDYNKYAAERDFAYGTYSDDKTYAYQLHRDEIEDARDARDFEEAKRQWEAEQKLAQDKWDWQKNNSGSSGSGSSSGSSKTSTVKTTSKPATTTTTTTPTTPTQYKAVNTTAVSNFKSGIQTKNEFYQGRSGGADKAKYGNYNTYIEAKLDEALRSGKLNENEVATLIVHYGLK